MTAKRDHEGGVSDEEPSSKRPRKLTGAQPRHHHQHSTIDPTWGQKYVFSNLDDATSIPYGEESDFEDDAEAIAYMRSVRKEAQVISHLLVAPTKQIGPQLPREMQPPRRPDDQDVSVESDDSPSESAAEAWSFYDDGAYMARDPEADRDGKAEDAVSRRQGELHDAFLASILDRYRSLRRLLHSKPPSWAAKRLSAAQPTYAAPLGPNSTTIKKWSAVLRHADPHPVQLALMSKDSVLRVLRVLLGGKLFCRGHTLSERTSRWLWGLLARLPDSWELNHADMARVRDLGRRAVLLGRSLAEMTALQAELDAEMIGLPQGLDATLSDDDDPSSAGAQNMEQPARYFLELPEGGLGQAADSEQQASRNGDPGAGGELGEHEDADGGESVAMDLSSDSYQEGSAVRGIGEAAAGDAAALEAAKTALLCQIGGAARRAADEDEREAARLRLRMNMRATVTMALTVAGDYYGQRDLLEFRQPFLDP